MLSLVAVSGLLATLYFAAAILLAVSGWAKLWQPGSAVRALRAAGLPSSVWIVRLLGVVEGAVGLGCLIAPGREPSAALAVLYLGFAGFLVRLLRSTDPPGSCGCVGAGEAPPTRLHVLLDLGAALSGIAVAVRPLPGFLPFAADLGLAGLPFIAGVALTAYLTHLVLAYLPAVMWSFPGESPEDGGPSSRPQVFRLERATASEEP
jgi:methylamine utilization protein MauE